MKGVMAVSPVLSLSLETLKFVNVQQFSRFQRFSVSRHLYKLQTSGSMRINRLRVTNGSRELGEDSEISLPDGGSSKRVSKQDGRFHKVSVSGDLNSLNADLVHEGLLLRTGFMLAFSGIGVPMFDSNASALELSGLSPSLDWRSAFAVEWVPPFSPMLTDLDAGAAQVASTFVKPFITLSVLLFTFRIVMSWYPGLPVEKFPFFLVYNPTEPVLGPTRKLIPPVGGVDVAPVIWVALMSFINEILLGKQGLLVLLAQYKR